MNPLPHQNAQFIQQLNESCKTLDNNIKTLNLSMKEMSRDIAAMQRALIEFLKEKEIITNEEDLARLKKLHMRHIAKLDQEIAERNEAIKKQMREDL